MKSERRTPNADTVRQQILNCDNCALSRVANPVPFHYENLGKIDLIVIGEAPGVLEDKEGKPFVGKSGKLLDEALRTVGTRRSRVASMNTVCCRPPQNRNPSTEEAEACRPNFRDQLAVLSEHCDVAVLLGNHALQAVLGKGITISNARGGAFWRDDLVFMPTFHPAYILRNPNMRKWLLEDLGMALRMSQGKRPLPDRATARAVAILEERAGGTVVSIGGPENG